MSDAVLPGHPSPPGEIDLHRAMTESMTVTTNLHTEVVVTTRDKISNTLHEMLPKFRRSSAWSAPASLATSLAVALLSTDFNREIFWISAGTWRALFWIALFGSLIWLAIALYGKWRRGATHGDVVDAITNTHQARVDAPISGVVTHCGRIP